jgi:hypothetical protein
LRVDARSAEEVERLNGLWKQAIPEVERKGGVGAAEASNEMVFEGADGAFSGITTMNMGRCELEIDGVVGHEALESGRCFVVEALEERS